MGKKLKPEVKDVPAAKPQEPVQIDVRVPPVEIKVDKIDVGPLNKAIAELLDKEKSFIELNRTQREFLSNLIKKLDDLREPTVHVNVPKPETPKRKVFSIKVTERDVYGNIITAEIAEE